MSADFESGFVLGWPRLVLRAEGGIVFTASIWLFAKQGVHWWVYPVLLFVPDIFMLGYVRSKRVGAALYNLGHSYPAVALLAAASLAADVRIGVAVASIWLGHIGWDRMFGYGLKYGSDFKHTHLGDLTRRR